MGRMIGKLSEERTCYVSIAQMPSNDRRKRAAHQSDLSADGLGSVRKTPSIRS